MQEAEQGAGAVVGCSAPHTLIVFYISGEDGLCPVYTSGVDKLDYRRRKVEQKMGRR